MKPYTLIGMPHSAAFIHLKQYLQCKNIPFTAKPADRDVLRSEVRARMGSVALPLIVTPDHHTWSNELAIIDQFEARYPQPDLTPSMASGQLVLTLIEMFGTKWLSPLIQAHIAAESPEAFTDRICAVLWPDAADQNALKTCRRLFHQTTRRLSRMGFDPSDGEALRTRLSGVLKLIEQRLSRGHFLLGDQLTRADLAISAPISLLWQHSPDIAARRSGYPGIQAWMIRILESGLGQDTSRNRLAHVPESTKPLAVFAAQKMIPIGFETASAIADWADAHPGKINLPAGLGFGSPERGGVGRRELHPELQWHLQRVMTSIDFDAMPASEREKLAEIGLADGGDWQLPRTIRYENHRFRVDLLSGQDTNLPSHDFEDNLHRVLEEARETQGLDALLVD